MAVLISLLLDNVYPETLMKPCKLPTQWLFPGISDMRQALCESTFKVLPQGSFYRPIGPTICRSPKCQLGNPSVQRVRSKSGTPQIFFKEFCMVIQSLFPSSHISIEGYFASFYIAKLPCCSVANDFVSNSITTMNSQVIYTVHFFESDSSARSQICCLVAKVSTPLSTELF